MLSFDINTAYPRVQCKCCYRFIHYLDYNQHIEYLRGYVPEEYRKIFLSNMNAIWGTLALPRE